MSAFDGSIDFSIWDSGLSGTQIDGRWLCHTTYFALGWSRRIARAAEIRREDTLL
jgi:hypothetical protein